MSSKMTRLIPGSLVALLFWLAVATLTRPQDDRLHVFSPDGQIEFHVLLMAPPEKDAETRLAYRVSLHGRLLMDTSFLGLQIQNQPLLGTNLKLISSKADSVDETYEIPVGKSKIVRNRYNRLVAEYQEAGALGRRLNLEVRAYDDGVAFRYVIPQVVSLRELRIQDEATQFQFAKDADSYPLILRDFRTSYEDQYHKTTISGIHAADLIATPFLVEQPGVGWVAVTEAHIENYAGMYLTHPGENFRSPRTMTARLAPRVEEPGLAVTGTTPLHSPWRVLMIASDPGRLIESNIVINLNPPCAIADTSWIKAGKTAWDWWSRTQTASASSLA
jgi:alpha-glucosidase